MGARWDMPAKLTEPAGDQLGAFGFREIRGARLNAVDPPTSERQRKFMAMCVNSPGKARKKCPKKSVAAEFTGPVQ